MGFRPGSLRPTPAVPLVTLRLSRDYPRQIVAAKARDGSWEKVGWGAYMPARTPSPPQRRALAAIVATHRRLITPHWFSHESAALLWGLPTWRVPTATHIRQSARAGGDRDRSIARHCGSVEPRHLVALGGLPVTDLEQTMVDCARLLRPLPALVVADAALRAGANRTAALAMLDEMRGNGVARARAIVELADEGAESPGETATRFVLLRDGLPRPQTQVPVVTRRGTVWTDVGWDEWGVLLEYDGHVKYSTTEDLVREKLRHDDVVETGRRLLRVTKVDIPARAGLADRVRRLLPDGVETVRRPFLRA